MGIYPYYPAVRDEWGQNLGHGDLPPTHHSPIPPPPAPPYQGGEPIPNPQSPVKTIKKYGGFMNFSSVIGYIYTNQFFHAKNTSTIAN